MENSLEKPKFQYLISCKCGKFHKFNIEYEKGFQVFFFCKENRNSIELKSIYSNGEYCTKCRKCQNIINIKQDYFKSKGEKLFFICEKCFSESKLKDYVKINEFKGENEDTEIKILDKIKNIKKPEVMTQFYNNNLEEIKELENFLEYLLFILKYFPSESKHKKIIKNFFNYLDYMIDIALKYTYLYDIYHFKKECNIYGDFYEDNNFLSEDFNNFYSQLLFKCSKRKILSLEMLRYIHQQYYTLNLAFPIRKYILISNYLKNKKENVKTKIYDITSRINKSYLSFELFIDKIKFENRICNLEKKLIELTGYLKLDKYNNSYFNAPGELSFLRKNVNLILDKVLKTNWAQIDFEEPNIKIIKKSFQYIAELKRSIDEILIKNDNIKKLKVSVKNKLENLENTLTKYKNYIERRDKVSEKISTLNPALIELTETEKKFLEENFIDLKAKFHYKTINSQKNPELQIIIDYLFELKERWNEIFHINDENQIKYDSIINHSIKSSLKNEKLNEYFLNLLYLFYIIIKNSIKEGLYFIL